MLISVLRTVLLYAIILIMFRLMGKRQISELQTSELVVTLLISDIAAIPMQDIDQPMISGILPILVLLICEIFISMIMLKHRGFRNLLCGNPVVLVKDGRLSQKAMKDLRLSIDDLYSALRQKDVFRLEEVSAAIAETNGKISVYKKPAEQTVTAGQMHLNQPDTGLEAVVISDGEIAQQSLAFCGLTETWLRDQLSRKGLRVQDVFIMTADKTGQSTVIQKEGKAS